MVTQLTTALKEWQVVCDLLGEGRQILLLRKGGIQEGQNRFEIAHRTFALLPTRLHQDARMLKPDAQIRIDGGETEPESFDLTHGGAITDILTLQSRQQMDRLNTFHCWARPYLDMRFDYRPERPLYLLLIRAYRLSVPISLKNTYEVGGCRSWVPLPEPVRLGEPVLTDADFARATGAVHDALKGD